MFDRKSVRASCCVSVLPPSTVPGERRLRHDGAAERDRIDAGMRVEAVILDRDERVLQVLGNLVERHVAAVLVHPEPAAAVGREKPRVADAARQAVHGLALAQQPRHGERRGDDQHREEHAAARSRTIPRTFDPRGRALAHGGVAVMTAAAAGGP